MHSYHRLCENSDFTETIIFKYKTKHNEYFYELNVDTVLHIELSRFISASVQSQNETKCFLTEQKYVAPDYENVWSYIF